MTEGRGWVTFLGLVAAVLEANRAAGLSMDSIHAFNVNAGGRFGGPGEGGLLVDYARVDNGRGYRGTVGLQAVGLACRGVFLARKSRQRLRRGDG